MSVSCTPGTHNLPCPSACAGGRQVHGGDDVVTAGGPSWVGRLILCSVHGTACLCVGGKPWRPAGTGLVHLGMYIPRPPPPRMHIPLDCIVEARWFVFCIWHVNCCWAGPGARA